jgi:hypothetical protein
MSGTECLSSKSRADSGFQRKGNAWVRSMAARARLCTATRTRVSPTLPGPIDQRKEAAPDPVRVLWPRLSGHLQRYPVVAEAG